MAETKSLQVPLVAQPAQDAPAPPYADDRVAVWRTISDRLVPIVGQRGVAALYSRSLYIARTDFPYLNALQDGALSAPDYGALLTVLTQQSDADAMAANDALLHNFYALLTRLIGEPLTTRLLRPIFDNHPSGIAEQKDQNDPA
jgi:hypothetical protein